MKERLDGLGHLLHREAEDLLAFEVDVVGSELQDVLVDRLGRAAGRHRDQLVATAVEADELVDDLVAIVRAGDHGRAGAVTEEDARCPVGIVRDAR